MNPHEETMETKTKNLREIEDVICKSNQKSKWTRKKMIYVNIFP